MNPLLREIEKLSSHGYGGVTRAEIDEMTIPTLDAKLYELTDAVAAKNPASAFRILAQIIEAREPNQVVAATLSRHARRLYLARLCLDTNRGTRAFMSDADVKSDWQADKFIATARRMTAETCRRAVLLCCDCALAINSGGGDEKLAELVAALVS
jgi:DNA polymerase-3 subunit delta